MFKHIIKVAALVCAMLIGLSLTGCADTSWALKVDNITIPSGVYITYLMSARQTVLSASSSSSSSSTGVTLNGTTSADAWSQKIEGQNALSWAINSSVDSCKQLAIVEELCAKKKIVLTADEKTTVSTDAANYIQNTAYASNGVSASSIERILGVNYFLTSELFSSYYGATGETPVADNDIKTYFTGNYVQIKQVFFNKYDDTNALLSADKLTALKAKANTVMGEVTANKTKFDSYVTAYNEDPGMQTAPNGYVFNKDESFIQLFKDTAFSMAIGDVKLIETDQGWHIMYKVPLDSDASWFTANKPTVLQSMKSVDFQALLKDAIAKAKVSINADTKNRYNPKNLKDS